MSTYHVFNALTFKQVWNSGYGSFPITPPTYDPLDEPSPLGLRLRKSPSLLELIQMKLSQSNCDKQTALGKKSQRASAISSAMDKLKASNFPASVLQIGTWEVYLNLLSLFFSRVEYIIDIQSCLLLSRMLIRNDLSNCSISQGMKEI